MTDMTLILRETERMGKKGRIIEAVFNGEVIASGTSPQSFKTTSRASGPDTRKTATPDLPRALARAKIVSPR